MSNYRTQTLTVLNKSDAPLSPEPSSRTGIDWARVLRDLATPRQVEDDGRRWRSLGYVEDLLPLKKCYGVADVGDPNVVTAQEFQADLAWMKALREEAASLGLRVSTDEWGNMLWVDAPVIEVVVMGEGRFLLSV
jgi:hypothetical protein